MKATASSTPPGMDIVDCQYHRGQGEIDSTLKAMDALGIHSLLIDEFRGAFDISHPVHIQPGYMLLNNSWGLPGERPSSHRGRRGKGRLFFSHYGHHHWGALPYHRVLAVQRLC